MSSRAKTTQAPKVPMFMDTEREVAYDREFRLSPLVEALDKANEYGITVVSMKRDWNAVFGDAGI